MDGKQAFPSIAPALGAVEQELRSQARAIVGNWSGNGSPQDNIERTVGHIFARQGKLLRPALVLLSAGMAEKHERAPEHTLLRLATAVELIHSASLVHDDIIDGEPLRRGEPTLNRRYGDHTAVLVGDLLYARSFALLTSLELPRWEQHREIFHLFCETTQAMCLGEIREQQVLESGSRVGFEEYLNILRNKTAVLMSACCRGAAIACAAAPQLAATLAEFGLSFGMAFQLLDDAADRDAPVENGWDLRAAAQAHLERAHGLLAGLAAGPSRTELEAACELILAAAAP